MNLFRPWRRWRGLLAALCLLAFASAAGIDALVCGGDVAVAAERGTDHDHGPGPDGAGEDASCQHGHCHHGGAFTKPAALKADAPAQGRQTHRLAPSDERATDRQFGLMRPPRD